FLVDNPAPLVADTHAAVLNNLLWLPVFTGLTVGLGLAIAILAGRVRYEAVVKSAVFVPMAISFVAASVIWRFMYEFNPAIGTLNAALTGLGRDATAWLQNTGSPWSWLTSAGPGSLPAPFQLNNFALILVAGWTWTGFAVVVLSAGLKGISADLVEAAR